MAYEVMLSETGNYLLIRLTGKVTIELAWDFSVVATQRANQLGIDGFLFDVREAANVESDTQNYAFAFGGMAELKLSKTSRAAVLRHPDDSSHDFLVWAAREAGYNVRIFTDRDEAVAWLEERPDLTC